MGRLGESVPLFEALLQARRKRSGDDHPETIVVAFNLAVNYRDAGRVGEAARVMDEWLPRGRARLGLGHPRTRFGMQAAVNIYERAGTPARAEPLLRDLADLARQQAGADSSPYAEQLGRLGLNLLKQQKGTDAEAALRQSLAIRRKKEPEAWTTFNVLSLVGETLLLQQKHVDAEPLLVQGYEGMKQREALIPLVGKSCLNEAVQRLVRLYQATGNTDKVAEWQGKLEAEQGKPQKTGKPR
jgi:hypothetical protein